MGGSSKWLLDMFLECSHTYVAALCISTLEIINQLVYILQCGNEETRYAPSRNHDSGIVWRKGILIVGYEYIGLESDPACQPVSGYESCISTHSPKSGIALALAAAHVHNTLL